MKFKLLKDLPWANKGQIVYADETVVGGWIAWSIRNEDDKKLGVVTMNDRTFYEWLEEVDERWKPIDDEKYFIVDIEGYVMKTKWEGYSMDYGRYKIGNCFKAEKEAQRAAEQIKALLKEFHKNNP